MCETSIKNKEGRLIELRAQRGPNCGLYALSLALNYLYGIDIPATKGDVKDAPFSLRELFKIQKKTIIGELYDADAFADFVNNGFASIDMQKINEAPKINKEKIDLVNGLKDETIKCTCVDFSLEKIKEIIENGGLCMVPFCASDAGLPVNTGGGAHWCIIHEYTDKGMKACQWGGVYDFVPEALESSNAAIADVPVSYWGKVEGESMLYEECESNSTTEENGKKFKKVETIPAANLSQTLAKKMIVFPHPSLS